MSSHKQPMVYIMANKQNGTLYTGVTAYPVKRVYEHRSWYMEGFTKEYGCKMLVYYELFGDMNNAIAREKQIKAGPRRKKLELIYGVNPTWQDLYEGLL